MAASKTIKDIYLAEYILKCGMYDLAFRLFKSLGKETVFLKNSFAYSSISFGLGISYCAFERYDLAYIQFISAQILCPNSTWALYATSNAASCIEEGLGGKQQALKIFKQNLKSDKKNIDYALALAFLYYQKREFSISSQYLYYAFKLCPEHIVTHQITRNLIQKITEPAIQRGMPHEAHDFLFDLADHFKQKKQYHKALALYRDWFSAEKKGMLCLLSLMAECYDKMDLFEHAIDVLKKQNRLFSKPSPSREESIKQKQALVRDAMPWSSALKKMDEKRNQVSGETRSEIQESVLRWGSLSIFSRKKSTTGQSKNLAYSIHRSQSCTF